MLRKLIYIFLLITLVIFSVSCNKALDNISEEDNQPSIEDIQTIKDPVQTVGTVLFVCTSFWDNGGIKCKLII